MMNQCNDSEDLTLNADLLMKNLDITRRTIEALDRSIIGIRQLFFVLLSITIAGASNAAVRVDLQVGLIIIAAVAIFLITLSPLLWDLDVHYHTYLRGAVRTAESIERLLGFNGNARIGVTINLEKIRGGDEKGFLIPGKIYFYPSVLFYVALVTTVVSYVAFIGYDVFYLVGLICMCYTGVIIAGWYIQLRRQFKKTNN